MRIFFYILLFFFSLSLSAQEAQLTINIKGLESNKGTVLLKIVNEKNEQVASGILEISEKTASKTFTLAAGKYAISSFHDKDNNKKLNTNMFGIPTEIYGFSNNVRGTFGPPELKAQLVELKGKKTIHIELK